MATTQPGTCWRCTSTPIAVASPLGTWVQRSVEHAGVLEKAGCIRRRRHGAREEMRDADKGTSPPYAAVTKRSRMFRKSRQPAGNPSPEDRVPVTCLVSAAAPYRLEFATRQHSCGCESQSYASHFFLTADDSSSQAHAMLPAIMAHHRHHVYHGR